MSAASPRQPALLSGRRAALAVALVAAIIATAVALGAIVWALASARGGSDDSINEFPWPSTGDAALAHGDLLAASQGGDSAQPIASLTKLITALVVLDRAPLEPGQQGPRFPMTEHDARLAQEEVARGGISTAVAPGQLFSQRELLEHMLITSSNNLSTSLVTRVFGSERDYLVAAREWLDAQGLGGVRIADASGMSPGNTASARDLLTIGKLAAAHPVIAEISGQPSLHTRGGEQSANTNSLLSIPGVTGLKTGHTPESGHTALLSVALVGSEDPLIVVILGSPSEAQRASDATRLIARVKSEGLG